MPGLETNKKAIKVNPHMHRDMNNSSKNSKNARGMNSHFEIRHSTTISVSSKVSFSNSGFSKLCFFIFSHSKFDVGRSMFDVHLFSSFHTDPPKTPNMVLKPYLVFFYPLFPIPNLPAKSNTYMFFGQLRQNPCGLLKW